MAKGIIMLLFSILFFSSFINASTIEQIDIAVSNLSPDSPQYLIANLTTAQLIDAGGFNQSNTKTPVGGDFQDKGRPIKIKIYAQQNLSPQILSSGVDIKTLQNSASIASNYYQNILNVIPYTSSINGIQKLLTNNCSNYPFTMEIPNEVRKIGFGTQAFDHVMFLTFGYQFSNVIAAAGPCNYFNLPKIAFQTLTFPPLSIINYNTKKIAESFSFSSQNGDFQFHQLVKTSIHEMGHTFGMLGAYFSGVYITDKSQRSSIGTSHFNYYPDRSEKKGNLLKLSTKGSILDLTEVNFFLRTHYNCFSDQGIGAILHQSNSHWDNDVFRTQIMTATYPNIEKMSNLTLSLFEGTGWYTSVNKKVGWSLAQGQGKGCDFLMKRIPDTNVQCAVSSQKRCNNEGNFQETCNGSQFVTYQFSQKTHCQVVNPSLKCLNTFGSSNNFNQPLCIQSQCSNSNSVITLKSNGQSVQCKVVASSQIVLFSQFTIQCPTNYNTFCNNNGCQKWCSRKGLCINGKCLDLSVQKQCLVSNCQKCNQNYNRKCMQCITGYELKKQGTLAYCSKIKTDCPVNCLNCENGFCFQCAQGFNVNENFTECVRSLCLASNCQTCQSNNQFACLICKQNFKKEGNSCIQISVSCNVSNCNNCSKNNVNDCQICLKGFNFKLENSLRKCQVIQTPKESKCSDVQNCIYCSYKNYCSFCKVGYRLDYIKNRCQIQNNMAFSNCYINNCQSCQKDSFSYDICLRCKPGYALSSNRLYCSLISLGIIEDGALQQKKLNIITNGCGNVIQYCQSCVQNENYFWQCIKCGKYYYLIENKCQLCHKQNPNCLECQTDGTNTPKCIVCRSGYQNVNGKCSIN